MNQNRFSLCIRLHNWLLGLRIEKSFHQGIDRITTTLPDIEEL